MGGPFSARSAQPALAATAKTAENSGCFKLVRA